VRSVHALCGPNVQIMSRYRGLNVPNEYSKSLEFKLLLLPHTVQSNPCVLPILCTGMYNVRDHIAMAGNYCSLLLPDVLFDKNVLTLWRNMLPPFTTHKVELAGLSEK